MRIAYFSPLPPQRTGIADYSADLLPYLAEYADITLFTADRSTVSSVLSSRFPVNDLSSYALNHWDYDLPIYHLGNSPYHRELCSVLVRFPGLLVLHDYVLHHFVISKTLKKGHLSGYVRELAYEHGMEGYRRAYRVWRGLAKPPVFEWPLNQRYVDLSLGIMVHSDYALQNLLVRNPSLKIQRVNQPLKLPSLRGKLALRSVLNLPERDFIVVSLGKVTQEKRLDLFAEAFGRFHRRFPNSLWLVVGEKPSEPLAWEGKLDILRSENAIKFLGYVDGLNSFYDYVGASDICVNLRYPTAGETSASALRAMAAGVPLIVSDVGWYKELPDGACVRISHNGTEIDQLVKALEYFYLDQTVKSNAGEMARAFVSKTCDPSSVAEVYIRFVKQILGSEG